MEIQDTFNAGELVNLVNAEIITKQEARNLLIRQMALSPAICRQLFVEPEPKVEKYIGDK